MNADSLTLKLTLKVTPYADLEQLQIQHIRMLVFHQEQGVDLDLDFDGLDETSTHILAYHKQEPIGTSRIRLITPTLAKVERVAVLQSFRGKGVGQALLEKAIAFLQQQRIPEVKLNAQLQVERFYRRLGFQACGAAFEEAGILHVEMRRKLDLE
jgi:predicted GNAT family N-acyltransferase